VSGHHLVSPSKVAGSTLLEVDLEYPNWFAQSAQYNFEPLLQRFAGQDGLHFLQLGAYTGDASVWMLENILTDPESRLTDVDTWQGSNELAHEEMDFDEVYKIYEDKTKKFISNLQIVRMSTFDWLINPVARIPSYDFIYVDADHTTVGVLLDAELSWPLLKSGGVMAFDDYTWGDHYPMHQRPKPGIDLFLLRHSGEYDVLAVNLQYWIRKH